MGLVDNDNGNSIDKDYRFRFRVDGPGSVSPEVKAIGNIEGAIWTQDEIPMFAINSPPLSDTIRVDFSRPINPVTLNLSAERIMGSSSGYSTPSAVSINWSSDFKQLTFQLCNVMHGSIYRIKIKGGSSGLKDQNGNFMKEDFVQMLRF